MTRYAITQTLKPYFHNFTLQQQLEKTIGNLKKVFHLFSPSSFKIVAELTKEANIHYHAHIECTCEDFEVIYKALTKTLGFSMIKICSNLQGWEEYMMKELTRTIGILNLRLLQSNSKALYKKADIFKIYALDKYKFKYDSQTFKSSCTACGLYFDDDIKYSCLINNLAYCVNCVKFINENSFLELDNIECPQKESTTAVERMVDSSRVEPQ